MHSVPSARPARPGRRALTLVLAALAAGALVPTADRDALAAPEDPPAPAGGVAVDAFFHGKVTKVDGDVVELTYDFSDAGHLLDFEASVPFRAIRTVQYSVKQGRVALQGTGSMRHKAVFDGDVSAEATFTPRKPRDFGFAVSEARESEVFTLYCCYDRYFGLGDNVHVPQNMIIKFIPRDPKVNKDGMQDWRYCGSRGQKPEISTGRPYRVAIGRTGIESRMTITRPDAPGDDFESKGREAGRDLTSMMVAVYAYDSQVDVDDLVIRGKLSAEWVAKNRIDLASWKPAAAAPAPSGGDPSAKTPEPAVSDDDPVVKALRAKIGGYPLETKAPALASLLRDTTVPLAIRTEAAEKAKSVGVKKIVPFLVEGLYSPDLDSRRLAFDVVKTLTGKSFGFRPEGPEDGRKKSIRDLNDHIQKNAADFL